MCVSLFFFSLSIKALCLGNSGTKSDVLMELKDSFLFLFPQSQLYIKVTGGGGWRGQLSSGLTEFSSPEKVGS